MRTFLVVMLLSVAFAGCLTDIDEGDPTDPFAGRYADRWHEDAIWGLNVDADAFDRLDGTLAHEIVHDHNNRSHHIGLSTPNFELLGWDPLVTDYYGATAGGHFCGGTSHVTEEGRQYSVIHSISSRVAIVIVDVTDPNNPFYVGELAMPQTSIYDATITSDGRYAVVSVSPSPSQNYLLEQAPSSEAVGSSLRYSTAPTFTDACGQTTAGPEADVPQGPGTMLVDIQDPTNPEILDMAPAPVLGPHSVDSRNIGGVEYVASSTTNLAYENSYFQFFTVEETEAGARLQPYSEYSAQYVQGRSQYAQDNSPEGTPEDGQSPTNYAGITSITQGHVEAMVYEHPVTGQLLAGLSGWDTGMVTIDISIPAAPVPLSTWGSKDDRSVSFSGAVHGMEPFGMMGDRFYVIAGQEVLSSYGQQDDGRSTGQMVLIDLTDPENPEAVARWTLPLWVQWNSNGGRQSLFSTHYFTTVDNTMFVSMYHGGLWAVDLSEEHWPDLPSLGVYVPDQQPEEPAASGFVNYSPVVLDVFTLDDDSLLLYDGDSGAYTVRFDHGFEIPVPDPWTKDAWIGS